MPSASVAIRRPSCTMSHRSSTSRKVAAANIPAWRHTASSAREGGEAQGVRTVSTVEDSDQGQHQGVVLGHPLLFSEGVVEGVTHGSFAPRHEEGGLASIMTLPRLGKRPRAHHSSGIW